MFSLHYGIRCLGTKASMSTWIAIEIYKCTAQLDTVLRHLPVTGDYAQPDTVLRHLPVTGDYAVKIIDKFCYISKTRRYQLPDS